MSILAFNISPNCCSLFHHSPLCRMDSVFFHTPALTLLIPLTCSHSPTIKPSVYILYLHALKWPDFLISVFVCLYLSLLIICLSLVHFCPVVWLLCLSSSCFGYCLFPGILRDTISSPHKPFKGFITTKWWAVGPSRVCTVDPSAISWVVTPGWVG